MSITPLGNPLFARVDASLESGARVANTPAPSTFRPRRSRDVAGHGGVEFSPRRPGEGSDSGQVAGGEKTPLAPLTPTHIADARKSRPHDLRKGRLPPLRAPYRRFDARP
jgi:hypothetical protein